MNCNLTPTAALLAEIAAGPVVQKGGATIPAFAWPPRYALGAHQDKEKHDDWANKPPPLSPVGTDEFLVCVPA